MAQAFHSTGFQPYRRTSQAQDNQTVCGTEKHAIDPKLGRIARKVCREKGVEHPKMGKTPPKFRHFSRDGKSSEQFVWRNLVYRCVWVNKLSTGI